MKLVIQRVDSAKVEVESKLISKIGKGFLILIGVSATDDGSEIEWLAKKTVGLRIFQDEDNKMNLSLKDLNGEILLVSQFTLYANCKKGKRPSFIEAALPEKAEKFYNLFAEELEKSGIKTKKGIFGAFMKVSLENNGPVTIILER
ncbi:MAG: D-tyrosyl-tRNA(Tyr) deacylase [Armatimonadetes bacterium]|nr:D-tyrosyl-tRNA(Tyr) deacylase [Armatimonadota bacterium]